MCVPHSSRFWLEWVVPHLRSGKVAVELRLTQSKWTYEESSSLLTAQKVKPTEVNFGPTDTVQIILSPPLIIALGSDSPLEGRLSKE